MAARRLARGGRWAGLVAWALAGCAVVLAIRALVVVVDGSSMAPTLRVGQVLLLNRASYLHLDGLPAALPAPTGLTLGGPKRGDLVVFHRARNQGYLVKRVIGLPGDLVQIDTGRVYVNGARLDEPYVVDPDDYTYPQYGGPLRVPANSYFVLGDNRPLSADSHLGWFVATDEMVGKALPLPLSL